MTVGQIYKLPKIETLGFLPLPPATLPRVVYVVRREGPKIWAELTQ